MTTAKTPREMARGYARSLWKTNHGNIILVADSERDYLAGIEAGAKMGWDARGAKTILEDGSQLTTWAYLNEWWASLEGEGEK